MDYLSDLFKKDNMGQVILVILFLIYIIMGYKTPDSVASVVDTLLGKLIVVLVAAALLFCCNPILGVLGLFVAFLLIQRSSITNGSAALSSYCPTEEKRMTNLTAMNQFPYTLEQEVVKKMAPIVRSGTSLTQASYKPLLDNLYDASPLNGSN
jgi:hypothetical protein